MDPVPLLALMALSLSLRLVFEQNLYGYYFMAFAVSLVLLDVVGGRIRGQLVAWLGLLTLAYNPFPGDSIPTPRRGSSQCICVSRSFLWRLGRCSSRPTSFVAESAGTCWHGSLLSFWPSPTFLLGQLSRCDGPCRIGFGRLRSSPRGSLSLSAHSFRIAELDCRWTWHSGSGHGRRFEPGGLRKVNPRGCWAFHVLTCE